MATASERYRKHKVWETLTLKRESLSAARFGDRRTEQLRLDVVEWLSEAEKTKVTRQPSLYIDVLDKLSNPLNGLPTTEAEFSRYLSTGQHQALLSALRALPLPPPKELRQSYVDLLDQEIAARTDRLHELEHRVTETEKSLSARQATLDKLEKKVEIIADAVEDERTAIKEVSAIARAEIDRQWGEALQSWLEKRTRFDEEQNAIILSHAASLAATARAGEALAEHAAGSLSATDWNGRSKRERRAAQWMRFGAASAFVFAGAVGWFIVSEAINNNFDLTVGDGILRASVATVIGSFGALLLRESGRHFREADTAEDVALSLRALAPFYASSGDDVRLAARVQVGDAVLVKNVLSRFAHRDATKHAVEINAADLPKLVDEATKALGEAGRSEKA
ncbi:hypothetical protein [Flaviflexus equikiangi]|uniref:Uncharacterized protein n=1 Tax=Flaviflexus equikiangi TaxID=2758573 RepID=A0ABS2TFU6_9ACTO|nr:hypothetical protein [Flaviflexus equikiangi]MBM9433207.1 hypothetical protein [Flaviflexus equikiangi]